MAKLKRRGFLKGAAAGAAALAGGAQGVAQAQQPAAPAVRPPSAAERVAETSVGASADVQIIEHPGSDYMVDVI
jgi:anaerobic selenocysteine-containing dehydrogenase